MMRNFYVIRALLSTTWTPGDYNTVHFVTGSGPVLLAWNEYLYAFLLLSDENTVPVALGFLLNSDLSPWNLLMAASIVHSLPPIVIYYLFRRYMAAGLSAGGIKGQGREHAIEEA